ncbi:MAG: peptidase M75 superfamily protein [Balneolaceae bacterium]|nr:peptidase M75 superfamily protein [Balneolaceae bacterium]
MKRVASLILVLLFAISCTKDNPEGPSPDDFDRKAILENWADNIIIPAFTDFSDKAEELKTKADVFTTNPDQQSLTELRSAWKTAYLSFQHVSMFEMGKAMDLRFRDNLNIYPTDTTEIQDNIQTGSYNLELPSLNDSQGFPALDYLLYGLGEETGEILTFYTAHQDAEAYKSYLTDLTNRIDWLTKQVLNDWTSGYRNEFVDNFGNGANASIDMMVNDYIFYYEKYLRAGKIGIPAGVFSGSSLNTHVEAYYSKDFSKALFNEALDASQNFFNGTHFESQQTGESLNSYLHFLQTMKEGTDLASLVNTQFEAVRTKADHLNANFALQVETDNNAMLSTYDELQKNVVLLKVDMLQALNINVDYVDADGD